MVFLWFSYGFPTKTHQFSRHKNHGAPGDRRAAVSLQMPPTASAGSRGTVTEFITKLRAAETPRMAPKEGEDMDQFLYIYIYTMVNLWLIYGYMYG